MKTIKDRETPEQARLRRIQLYKNWIAEVISIISWREAKGLDTSYQLGLKKDYEQVLADLQRGE